ncbi:MAG: 2Fe-2S iron-sulfur cluster-binding protein [Gemmatimonadota bacterium]
MSGHREQVIHLTIDGVEVEVAAGTRVIEAAERAGVVVPHYCYHPGIPTRPAQCRMCLVEVEGQPKLQPSCVLAVQEGMVVHTDAEAARAARRSVIEFLLLNHPLDCPICDAAGQCMLQDYAFETQQLESRFQDDKLVLGRDKIADDILYFADRCIICTRCVRFMRDVAGDDALVVAQRGHKAYIDTFPGRTLDNAFRGNIVDVCPVGALVHEDYLFKARAWDLDSAASVCPGCATGCNITVDAKENQIVRVKPRFNGAVNAYWMCDYGRRHLVMANRGERAELPLVRRDGRLAGSSWDEAIAAVAEGLAQAGGGTVLVSPGAASESLYYLRRLLDAIGIGGGEYRMARGEEAALPAVPTLRLRAERAPNASGAELFGFREAEGDPPPVEGGRLLVLGDPLDGLPDDFGAGAEYFLYVGSRLTPAVRNASAVLPAAAFGELEGTFVNADGRVQRFHQVLQPPGVARPAWMVLSRLLAALGEGEAVTSVRTAFARMASEIGALEGLSWSGLGLRGAPLAGAGASAGVEA